MTLTDKELWIAEFAGAQALGPGRQLDLAQEWQIRRAKDDAEWVRLRRAHLAAAHERVSTIESMLTEFREVRLKVQDRLTKLELVGNDVDGTFGFLRDMSKVVKSPKNMPALYKAQDEVLAIRRDLEAATMERGKAEYGDTPGDDGVLPILRIDTERIALFTKKDVETEFYTRLVRSLLYPEELVPDQFSAVQRMIDESNKLYIAKLQTVAKVKDNPLERFGPVLQSLVKSTASLANTVVAVGEHSSQAKELVSMSLTIAEVIINTGIDLGVQISKADACKGVSGVLDGLSGGVEAALKVVLPALGVDPTVAKNVAKGVAVGMRGASRIPMLVDAVANPKYTTGELKAGAFIDVLGNLWGDVFDGLAIGQDDKSAATLAQFKNGVQTSYRVTAVALKGQIGEKLERGDWAGVRAIMGSMSMEVVQGGLKGVAIEQGRLAKLEVEQPGSKAYEKAKDSALEQMRNDGKNPSDPVQFEKAMKEAISSAKESIDAAYEKVGNNISSGSSDLIAGLTAIDSSVLAEKMNEQQAKWAQQRETALRKVEEEADAEYKEQFDKENEAFEAELMMLQNPAPSESDMAVLGKMIAKIQRDKAIMDTLFAVGKLSTGLAAQFFAPMAAAGTLVTVVQEGTLAVQRTIHLRKWLDSRTAATNAVSPYLASIQNFCKNLEVQLSHHTIKAALNGLKLAGNILQTIGTFVPYAQPALIVGKIIAASADVALSTEELVYTAYKEDVLRTGWKETKRALANPKDRKTNQIARNINPTFAKYTIAYGMYIEKDPVALEAGRKVKLTRQTLASKDAGVDKIVLLLETLYYEDVQILKHYEGAPDWVKKAARPRVAVGSWMQIHHLALTEGKLNDTRPEPINQAFAVCEEMIGGLGKLDRNVTAIEQTLARVRPDIDSKQAPREPLPEQDALDATLEAYEALRMALDGLERVLDGFQPERTVRLETGLTTEPHPDMVGFTNDFLGAVAGERTTLLTRRTAADRAKDVLLAFHAEERVRQVGA